MTTHQSISHPSSTPAYRLLDLNEVKSKAGVSTTFIYTTEGFPKPVKMGRRSFWVEHEIDQFIERRAAARG